MSAVCENVGFKCWSQPGQTFYHALQEVDICEIMKKMQPAAENTQFGFFR